VILSGSQSALVPVADGDELVCTVGGLGSCRVKLPERHLARPLLPASPPRQQHRRMNLTPARTSCACVSARRRPDPRLRHPKLTDEYPGMTIGDGYAADGAAPAFLAAGHKQVGWKAGLT
jgi:2-keto-4-pentenoate hydratase